MRFNEFTEQRVQEGGMPASIIRVKEKIRLMTDAEKKEYFKGKTREQLVGMARSHGYGENSNVYAQYVSEGLNEFAPGNGNDEGSGDDPYKYPKPEHFSRSIDFFGQFEADHFDREDMNDATGEFKGYWGKDQLAYFKFDNPRRTGNDDPGMGWYYEPNADSNNNNVTAVPAVDNADERKQQELDMINAFLKSGNRPNPDSQIGRLMKKHGLAEGANDKFSVADKVEELVRYYKLFDKRGWTDLFSKLAGKKLYGQEYKAEIRREMEYTSKFLDLLDSIRMRSDYRGQQDPIKDQELIDLSNQWLSLFNKATDEFKAMSGQGVAEGRYDNRNAYQRDYDNSQTGFGRGERDNERHDIDTNNEYRAEHGTWYIRIDGMVDPTPYQGKAAANAAGLELKKQPGNENRLFMLTTKA